LAPVLSPNKSVEGLAGGVVLAIGAAIGIGYLMDPFDIQAGAALGLVVAAVAPLGDLAESALKRSLGVKDMGTILPGHGGILDRIDAFLFVIPPAWVLYEMLGYLA
jgi:phosphatidate cytidylyltransferase